ncbi:SDR family NAD(P)-dependent oxidoreductase [Nonomuraea purpurea]|uniref:SDR family NAD(P)-dependent oxidoreductase n=1 Tax=Nonomuraea purpurea TaxID=1849276 RepID=A0ABV8GJ96_9ACTN
MERRFDNKVAVVTGGSRGIGAAVAERLAAEGASVAIGYRANQEAADAVVAALTSGGGRAIAVQADVLHASQTGRLMDAAVAEFGRLDVLVCCAGIEHFGPLGELTRADFDRVLGINAGGQLFAVQHAVRHMRPGGRIVLTSSVSASRAIFHHTLYAAGKAAVEAMVLNLAAELGLRGITINAVAPGGTATDMAAENGDNYPHPELNLSLDAWLRTHTSLRRLGEPKEIAAAYAFLASDDASYLTGRTLAADGGYL